MLDRFHEDCSNAKSQEDWIIIYYDENDNLDYKLFCCEKHADIFWKENMDEVVYYGHSKCQYIPIG